MKLDGIYRYHCDLKSYRVLTKEICSNTGMSELKQSSQRECIPNKIIYKVPAMCQPTGIL
jgi:hypothetical protein